MIRYNTSKLFLTNAGRANTAYKFQNKQNSEPHSYDSLEPFKNIFLKPNEFKYNTKKYVIPKCMPIYIINVTNKCMPTLS